MTLPETKTCQNCKNPFPIEPEDFVFYEKMKVPTPTFCPACRFRRRMTWRNDWHLFHKKDALTGKDIFSLYPQESPVQIYDRDYWWSDQWNPLGYGKEYDFSRPFFSQFKELFHTVPLPAHSMYNMVNCQYCTNANNCKNCYLARGASHTEDSAYLIWDGGSKQCFDSHMTKRCELGYGNVNTTGCYKTFFSVDCEDCQEIALCRDCVGCASCFGCVGLRNKSYCFFNQQLTKEEYTKKIAELNAGSFRSFQEAQARAYAQWLAVPHKYIHGRHNVNVTGDYIFESKNTLQSFRVQKMEDSKFCQNILDGAKDCYDYANWGGNVELIYECLIIGNGGSHVKFSTQCFPNVKNLQYCAFCNNSSDLFGCVGLRNKQYCILNKQYTKEKYDILVPRIIAQMQEMPYRDPAGHAYGYGEFFPPELSPFPYHATAAYEFFPVSETDAMRSGYNVYPVEQKSYPATLPCEKIPDHIKDVADDILNEIIECAHQGRCKQECVGAFRVIKDELEFCRRMDIPLPRLCPNCRHYERLALRNAPRFYRRTCQCAGGKSENNIYSNQSSHFHGNGPCPNEFETSYSQDRPEIVYCEQCYQSEIV